MSDNTHLTLTRWQVKIAAGALVMMVAVPAGLAIWGVREVIPSAVWAIIALMATTTTAAIVYTRALARKSRG